MTSLVEGVRRKEGLRRTELGNQLLELDEVELLFSARGTHCCKFVRAASREYMQISPSMLREQHDQDAHGKKGYGYKVFSGTSASLLTSAAKQPSVCGRNSHRTSVTHLVPMDFSRRLDER